MPAVNTQGIVLRTVNYRDHDRMLTLLTPAYGCLDVLSRGCKRPKSPLMPCSELFVCGEFTLFRGKERAVLVSCEIQDNFYPLRLDPYRLCCASYMAALSRESAPPEAAASRLYGLLLKGLYTLSYDSSADALGSTAAFLLLLADLNGYRPRLLRCVHCQATLDLSGEVRMDLAAGGLCCPACTPPSAQRLSHEELVWISQTLREGELRKEGSISHSLFILLRDYVSLCMDIRPKAGNLLP